MKDVERLQKVIKDLHGLDSHHTASVMVRDTIRGKTFWNGIVEIFQVHGNKPARFAYAWTYKYDKGAPRDVAVLGLPPIDSAKDAVHAYIVAQAVRKSS